MQDINIDLLVSAVRNAKTEKQKSEAIEKALANLEYLVHGTIRARFDAIPAGIDRDDLVQEGLLALMGCLTEFDPYRGVQFRTYAITCISNRLSTCIYENSWSNPGRQYEWKLNKISDELQKQNGKIPTTEDIAEYLNMDLEDVNAIYYLISQNNPVYLSDTSEFLNGSTSQVSEIISDNKKSVEEQVDILDCKDHIIKAIDKLPDTWKTALLLHSTGLTYKEIGEELNLCSQRVAQLVTDAKNRVKGWFIDNNLIDVLPSWIATTEIKIPSHRNTSPKRKRRKVSI